jgi:hypothetical protein
MNNPYHEHPNEEALERFILNMSPEQELDILEPHILACGKCVEQLETLEIEIAATRLALRQLLATELILQKSAQGHRRWTWWLAFPKWSFVTGGALAAAAVVLFWIPRDVTLTAYRGVETAIVSQGWRLNMHLNGQGLAPGPVAVQLADHSGAIVWSGTSIVRDSTVNVAIPRLTKSGSYYLRLYSLPYTGSGGDLLREFALEAR